MERNNGCLLNGIFIVILVITALVTLVSLTEGGSALFCGIISMLLIAGGGHLYFRRRRVGIAFGAVIAALVLCFAGIAALPDYSPAYGTYYTADQAQNSITLSQKTNTYESHIDGIEGGTYTYDDGTLTLISKDGGQLSYRYVDQGDDSYFTPESDDEPIVYKSRDDARQIYEEKQAAEEQQTNTSETQDEAVQQTQTPTENDSTSQADNTSEQSSNNNASTPSSSSSDDNNVTATAPAAPIVSNTTTSNTTTSNTDSGNTTVYITKTGEKYHRAGCRYLRQSSIPITLSNAKAEGYTPCSVCDPPE